LTKNVGFQYAKLGIRCNAIAPGAVNTNIGNTIYDPNKFGMERAMAGINLNPRVGEPEEIAKIALFLACDDSSFINGNNHYSRCGLDGLLSEQAGFFVVIIEYSAERLLSK